MLPPRLSPWPDLREDAPGEQLVGGGWGERPARLWPMSERQADRGAGVVGRGVEETSGESGGAAWGGEEEASEERRQLHRFFPFTPRRSRV